MNRRKTGKHGDLWFHPTVQLEGFNSKQIAADDLTNPSVIVRELIQNSMDASLEASRDKCIVDFEFDEIRVKDIPGIETYRQALASAKKANANSMEAAEAILERIEKCLELDRIPVLNVVDNGIGLDTERMHKILGDGNTDKVGSSADRGGSYGVGHYTAFPASDLRYITYGGVSETNKRCMSGHAILASHPPPVQKYNSKRGQVSSKLLGKDGHYITGYSEKQDFKSLFSFCKNNNVPTYVSKVLDRISSSHRTGSVVSILGFNHFREDERDSVEEIFSAAASSFFIPLHSGKLEVSVVTQGKRQTLTNPRLADIIDKHRGNKRRTKRDILRGESVNSAFRTYLKKDQHTLETNYGTVQCFYREADLNESTRLLLFRNGMFITADVPSNTPARFNGFKRFIAVLNIEPGVHAETLPSCFQLVRKAEGDKHLDLEKSRLPSRDRQHFDSFFKEVFECIESLCTKDEADTYYPDIFGLELDSKNLSYKGPPSQSNQSQRQTLEELESEGITSGDDTPGNGTNPNANGANVATKIKKLRRQSTLIPVKVVARRAEQNVDIQVVAQKKLSNGLLQLDIHGGADVSCDLPVQDEPAEFIDISRDGKHASSPSSVFQLGRMEVGDTRRLTLEVTDPPTIPNQSVLKVAVFEAPRLEESK